MLFLFGCAWVLVAIAAALAWSAIAAGRQVERLGEELAVTREQRDAAVAAARRAEDRQARYYKQADEFALQLATARRERDEAIARLAGRSLLDSVAGVRDRRAP